MRFFCRAGCFGFGGRGALGFRFGLAGEDADFFEGIAVAAQGNLGNFDVFREPVVHRFELALLLAGQLLGGTFGGFLCLIGGVVIGNLLALGGEFFGRVTAPGKRCLDFGIARGVVE